MKWSALDRRDDLWQSWGLKLGLLTPEPAIKNNLTVLCAQLLTHVWLFVTPWIAARQVPLSMGILQARILEWVAMPSSRGSSQPRDQTQVSCIAGEFFTNWATREALTVLPANTILQPTGVQEALNPGLPGQPCTPHLISCVGETSGFSCTFRGTRCSASQIAHCIATCSSPPATARVSLWATSSAEIHSASRLAQGLFFFVGKEGEEGGDSLYMLLPLCLLGKLLHILQHPA